MKYGVIAPNIDQYSQPALLVELAQQAEEAGWDGFFIWGLLASGPIPRPVADPWIALAAIAMSTQRIRLGPMVTPLPRRRPWKLARETTTLDHLSSGRLILGVGLGGLPYEEFEAFGEAGDLKLRAAKLDEGLAVLAGLWRAEHFSYNGQYYQVKDAHFLPPPRQSLRIPIWVGGTWPMKAPFRRAARWDGVIPAWDIDTDERLTPEDMGNVISFIQKHRGSGDQPFDVVFGGQTSGSDISKDGEIVASYAKVGVTWWLEDLNPGRGPLEKMRERIHLGPPEIR